MPVFYHKLDFDLSPTAKQWVLDRYKDRFNEAFYHDLDVSQLVSAENRQAWDQSPAGAEIKEFLSQFGCDTKFYSIVPFISNTKEFYVGNPHIDLRYDNTSIKSRLNIMVLGNPEDEMVWWDWLCYGDERLVEEEYENITGETRTWKNVPGNTKDDRLAFLGEPTVRVKNVLTPSAFVKTNCAHTVNISPVPRLIVSVALSKSIEEVLDYAGISYS